MSDSSKKSIFIVGHSLIQEESRKRWKILAQLCPSWEIFIVIPKVWQSTWFGKVKIFHQKNLDQDNYHIIPVEVTNVSDWSKYRIKNLYPLLKKVSPDLIFVMQEEFTFCHLQILLTCKFFLLKTKVFFFSWQNIKVSKDKLHKKIIWNLICRYSSGMIAGTQQIKNIFIKANYKKPIFVQTEIGVDSDLFKPSPELRLKYRQQHKLNNKFVIGFCGRIIEEKGIHDLVLASLKLSGDWILLLVGDGQLRTEVERIFQDQNKFSQLIITGEVSVEETKNFYSMMDLLVLPSRTTPHWREQFGLVLAQAMLSGIPVIGSDSGAIPEVIGKEKYIYPEGDVDALWGLLKKMQNDISIEKPFAFPSGEKYSVKYLAADTVKIINYFD